jgi:hypothetical protein
MIAAYKFLKRCPVEERNGSLYVGGVRLAFDDATGRLANTSFYRVEEAVAAEAQARGENMPVALVHTSGWLRRCARCRSPFLGHYAATLCSEECRMAQQRDHVRKAWPRRSAREIARRDAARAARVAVCRQCGGPIVGTERPSRRLFCSTRCRMRAHRAIFRESGEKLVIRNVKLDRT